MMKKSNDAPRSQHSANLRSPLALWIAASLCAVSIPACSSARSDANNPDEPTTGPGLTPPDAKDALRADLDEARRLLRAEDPDGALTITDRVLRKGDAPQSAFVIAAEANLALANAGRAPVQAFFQDALRQLEIATDMEPKDPGAWSRLGETHYQLQEFEEGAAAAEQAATLRNTRGDADSAVADDLIIAAKCRMQTFVAARQDELANPDDVDANGNALPGDETTRLAQQVFTLSSRARGARPGEAHRLSAQVYQWLHQTTDAMQEYERGIRKAPADTGLHTAYQDLFIANDRHADLINSYRRMSKDMSGVPAMKWFSGRAYAASADNARGKSAFDEALQKYAKSAELFSDYAAEVPEHAGASNHWIAICELSLGRVMIDAGRDLDRARAHLDTAFTAFPAVANYNDGVPEVLDSFGSNYLSSLFRIGQNYSSRDGADGLRKALKFWDELNAKHPESFGAAYNNAAFTARDLGSAVAASAKDLEGAAKQAKLDEAQKLWEKSYTDYVIAADLEPNDPRIVNDAGLMLIYHLHRDFDDARRYFDSAILVGEEKLAALPSEGADDERQFLEEAVGDAYQNIAVLMRDHQDAAFADVEPFLQKAVRFYPYKRREAARMLRRQGDAGQANAGSGALSVAASQVVANRRPSAETLRVPANSNVNDKKVFDGAAAEAKPKADAGDYDGALLVLDRHRKTLKDYAPYHALVGKYTLALAESRIASGATSGVENFFADSARSLEKAIELDDSPLEPRVMLANVQWRSSKFTEAAKEAKSAILHAQSMGDADAKLVVQAKTTLAVASARLVIDAAGAGEKNETALQDARDTFRSLEESGEFSDEMRNGWSVMEEWAGAGEPATSVWVRALKNDPASATALEQLVVVGGRMSQAQLAVDTLKSREDALGKWYLGRAYFGLGNEKLAAGAATEEKERDDTALGEALAALDDATAAFDRSAQANATYTDSVQQWKALTLGKRGQVLWAKGDVDGAFDGYLAAAKMRPDMAGEELGGGTISLGLQFVQDHHFRVQQDLKNAERTARASTMALPGDALLANNHGLFARDHGVRLERRDNDLESAKEMYEASYESYKRAQALEPDSIRLRNDVALMILYHIKRDYDVAKEMLDSAIRMGDAQLESAGGKGEETNQDLEEAVGDAHENMALYMIDAKENPEGAITAAEAALTYHPGSTRAGAIRHKNRAEGIIEERDKPPTPDEPTPGDGGGEGKPDGGEGSGR